MSTNEKRRYTVLNVGVYGGTWCVEGPGLKEALRYHARAMFDIHNSHDNTQEALRALELMASIKETEWTEFQRLTDLAAEMNVSVTLHWSMVDDSHQAAEQEES